MNERLNYNLNWDEYFRIGDVANSGLIRIKNSYNNSTESFSIGTRLFQRNGDPRAWQIGFKNKLYLAHRIIWVMVNGSMDSSMIIDHLDGDPFNNRIENLSLKTQKDNTRNSRKRKDNKTGVTGVILISNGQGQWYYYASCNEIDGTRQIKYFSIDKLGEETAKSMAIAHREQQIQRLIVEGADYTDRHGN